VPAEACPELSDPRTDGLGRLLKLGSFEFARSGITAAKVVLFICPGAGNKSGEVSQGILLHKETWQRRTEEHADSGRAKDL
jgi:hypothetical protein